MYEITFLTREVTGGRKSCSPYIFLKKTPTDCSTVIIQSNSDKTVIYFIGNLFKFSE